MKEFLESSPPFCAQGRNSEASRRDRETERERSSSHFLLSLSVSSCRFESMGSTRREIRSSALQADANPFAVTRLSDISK